MAERDKEVHGFHKSISPKVNIISQLEFEFRYLNVIVQHFNQYIMRNTKVDGLSCSHIHWQILGITMLVEMNTDNPFLWR